MRFSTILSVLICVFMTSGFQLSAQVWEYPVSGKTWFNGNVGIHTNNPQALLDLGADVNGAGGKRLFVYNNYLTGVQAGFGIDMSGNGRELAIFHPTHDHFDGDISFGNIIEPAGGYTENMRITGDGRVGIGTKNPQAKLAVNGDVFCKKITVTQNGWPDYVFHANYRLRPLSEVEQYINQYHHLPEVVTAEEVEKNGLDVAGNQAALLKKIEELTLYVIEQDKQQSIDKQKLQTLEKEVAELKAVIRQVQKEKK